MKLTKKAQLLFVATVLPLLLAGCTVQYNENKEPIGWLYNYLVVPTQWLLNQIASVFNGNYAIAIVIVSILVRVLLMPTQFHQMKTMLVQQEKMAVLKPYIAEITARAEQASTPQEKLAIQQEQMELYKLNNVSLMGGIGSGCLPILHSQSGADCITRFYYQMKFQAVISWESTLEHNSYQLPLRQWWLTMFNQ